MKIRRLLCCLLALAAFVSLALISASAAEDYRDPLAYGDGTEFPQSVEEAAAQLREGLKKRQQFTDVSFHIGSDRFDGSSSSAEELAQQIIQLAYAHTGTPDEGDYIRYHVGYIGPEVDFWWENDGWQFEIQYYAVYYSTPEQEAALDAEIARLVEQLELKSTELTDYQKLYAVYDYICSTVAYDYEHLEDDTYIVKWAAYAAAVDHTAVCQGYATLLYRLALEAGIDNRVITGMAVNPQGEQESHAWNIVRLDGEYYCVDATWDAGQYDYWWLLKTEAEFADHDPDALYLTDAFRAAHPISLGSFLHPYQPNATENGYEYRVQNGAAVLISYTGTETDIVVPAKLGGYPVKAVSSCAFYCLDAQSITFSEGIRTIESEAIIECRNLRSVHYPSTAVFTASPYPEWQCRVACGPSHCPNVETVTVAEGNQNVVVVDNVMYSADMKFVRYYPAADPREYFEIPEGVQSIGASAFSYASNLKEVKMPDTVIRLQTSAFADCSNLEKINISESCTYIDQYVFNRTALESIHIPASVDMLFCGSLGFESKLKQITVDPANPIYYVEDGVLYADFTQEYIDTHYWPGDRYYPGKWMIKYPLGREDAVVTVPEGVVGIEALCFADTSAMKQITLPESLLSIHIHALYNCTGLSELKLPDGLLDLHNSALESCTSLVQLVIPESVAWMGYYVVGQNHLENVVFLGDAPEMSDQTFAWENLNICYPADASGWQDIIAIYPPEGEYAISWHALCENHQFTDAFRAEACDVSGYKGQKCTVCGLIEFTEITAAPGHDWQISEQEQSCTTDGGTARTCKTCGIYTISNLNGYALGHDYVDGVCIRCGTNEWGESFADVGSAPQIDREFTEEEQKVIKLMLGILGAFIAVPCLTLIIFRKKPEKAAAAAEPAEEVPAELAEPAKEQPTE